MIIVFRHLNVGTFVNQVLNAVSHYRLKYVMSMSSYLM